MRKTCGIGYLRSQQLTKDLSLWTLYEEDYRAIKVSYDPYSGAEPRVTAVSTDKPPRSIGMRLQTSWLSLASAQALPRNVDPGPAALSAGAHRHDHEEKYVLAGQKQISRVEYARRPNARLRKPAHRLPERTMVIIRFPASDPLREDTNIT
jgi:hypothetical protein